MFAPIARNGPDAENRFREGDHNALGQYEYGIRALGTSLRRIRNSLSQPYDSGVLVSFPQGKCS